MVKAERARWFAWGASGLAAAASLALLGAFLPSLPQTVCWTRRLLDLPCAGCGMTRALAALARGRVAEAITLHPLSVVLAGEAVLLWLGWAALNAGLVRPPSARTVLFGLVANGAVLLAVWVVRLAFGIVPT